MLKTKCGDANFGIFVANVTNMDVGRGINKDC